jgi:ribosome biogenesis GTPase A
VALNKADLADPRATEQWLAYFRAQGLEVVAIEASTGKGAKTLVSKIEKVADAKIQAMVAKGVRPRAVRAMILGIPNVGKSSLINRLLGTATTRTGDKPGVTRGKQWIKIGKNLELLDTPGVLWPKLDDHGVALRLAITGAISDDVFDLERVMARLLSLLREKHPESLVNRYKLAQPLPLDNNEILTQIGHRRGCLRSGGVVDLETASRIVLHEFRAGTLGVFTLDSVDEQRED